MNTMRCLLVGTAIALEGIAACNYTVGECYYLDEGNGGGSQAVTAGGGVIVPTGPSGAGGFGDTPPKQPQDATTPDPPVCNIVSLSPCHEQCDAEDEARAIGCAKIQHEAQRRACNDSSHEKYKACIEVCENAPRTVCQEKWERCTNFAPFLTCASKGSGSGGKSRCDLCWQDCDAGKPVSSICKKCLF